MNHKILLIYVLVFSLLGCISCENKKVLNDRVNVALKSTERKLIGKSNHKTNDSLLAIGKMNSLVIFRLSEKEVSKFKDTSRIGYAIYEIDSDFGFNLNKLRDSLKVSKFRNLVIIDSIVNGYKINDSILYRRKMKSPYGFILYDPKKDIKIINGIKHWKYIYNEIELFFKS